MGFSKTDGVFSILVLIFLVLFIILIILLCRLVAGSWFHKNGGPAISVSALVYTQTLETMNAAKDAYADTLKPKHFLNNYFLEAGPGEVLINPKHFAPGMQFSFTNTTGGDCELLIGDDEEPIILPTGTKKFIIDAANEFVPVA